MAIIVIRHDGPNINCQESRLSS